jgi:hypothetical protein
MICLITLGKNVGYLTLGYHLKFSFPQAPRFPPGVITSKIESDGAFFIAPKAIAQ